MIHHRTKKLEVQNLRRRLVALDTVALVEKNAQAKPSREVPTWAGVLGIVLVSALSFAVTYRLRLSSNERNAASPSATLETAATPPSPR